MGITELKIDICGGKTSVFLGIFSGCKLQFTTLLMHSHKTKSVILNSLPPHMTVLNTVIPLMVLRNLYREKQTVQYSCASCSEFLVFIHVMSLIISHGMGHFVVCNAAYKHVSDV